MERWRLPLIDASAFADDEVCVRAGQKGDETRLFFREPLHRISISISTNPWRSSESPTMLLRDWTRNRIDTGGGRGRSSQWSLFRRWHRFRPT